MKLDTDFAITVMGVAFVFLGLYIRLGNLKKLYWKSRRSMTGYIPLGFVFILAGYYETASQQSPAVFYAYIALLVILIGLTLWAGARPPDILKPRWLTWVEKHPKAIQKAMATAAENEEDWEKHVTSKADVDAWAKQLARGLPKKK